MTKEDILRLRDTAEQTRVQFKERVTRENKYDVSSEMVAGSCITRALKFTPDIKFVNDETLNEFVVTAVEQIYAGEETRARNQRIQNMFRMIGFGENLGSGFPLILSAWNEKHWLKPELIEQRELMQVKLILSIETKEETPLVSGEGGKELPDVLKNVLKDVRKDVLKELSDRQIDILEIVCTLPEATWIEMSEKLKVSDKTIQREFTAIRKLGIDIVRKDGRKNGRWEIKISK